ncbi:hypothetical protein POSPLADRAFT_1183854 [Postia placenta MAD-698-R-SB12]|uniref:Dol-P-Man:Man(5)GlcNAc(2)-PP-Dol alpha-1,3-mannosyltransferase n=1 Tax=Postia placenta MAD-698-R-SB12 TaxID=670580 RepID=A0A1X6MSF2_9APHY|nr:hypothetical protein POSPLADRAFT_1183854 [Postia placenta MAD-698-R-SB12]OSX59190.1 hypothetical protein POSPLADRAFT_1183854 [Postia placenta MAD-698-R-SB12]
MVAHLPPVVKQLLTLRNPHTFPGPPVAKLNDILTRTFRDAQQKKVEKGWLTLTTCTLLTANVPSSVGHLYRFVTRDDPNKPETRRSLTEALDKAALMRESAMKSCIFVGVPRTILSFAGMFEAFEDDVKKDLRNESIRIATPENIESIKARGQALWDTIYQPHAVKLYNKLGGYHPDFIVFIIQAYGAVLSPLPEGDAVRGNLSRALGSVVGTACLRAEEHVGPQLTSHVFGLLKARYVQGLSEEDYWLATDEGTEWVIRTVDSILDVVKPEQSTEPRAKL